jgi:hypothetical protein
MNSDVTVTGFRDFMEWSGTTGRKSDTNLGLLLNWASDSLERASGRLITSSGSNTTRRITTHGRAYVGIPDLRAISGDPDSITLQGTTLEANSTYHLVASRQDPTIYVAVQLRAFGTGSYLANPDWFDRNLDMQWARSGGYESSLPNDLVITGLWGHTFTPSDWKFGIYSLAGYGYQHADALFSGARATPEGNIFDLSTWPSEVRAIVDSWSLADQVAVA